MSSANSLRPAWRNQSGGRGFQPPPSVASERGRSQSIGSSGDNSAGENRTPTYNKFSALDDDEDVIEGDRPPAPKGNSRSEALRQGLGSRSSSTGKSLGGRRLADLAASAPTDRPTGYSGGGGRYGARGAPAPIDEGKIIRFTREKLLSMRPAAPSNILPDDLKPLAGNVIISEEPQDPVCWDTFDAEVIWAAVPRRAAKPGPPPSGRSLSDMAEGAPPPRRGRETSSGGGRWQRGVALPPPSAADKARKDKDAENPDDLWDDPMAAPAADFSAFGDLTKEGEDDMPGAFDFEKMAEESRILEDEMRGRSRASSEGTELGEDGEEILPVKTVDPHRPLASVGTTIRSGSGDDVNVFEDFDDPASSDSTPTAVDPLAAKGSAKTEPNNSNAPGATDDEATSRLMAMIGVSSPETETKTDPIESEAKPIEPEPSLTAGWGEPGKDVVDGLAIPLNPWGGPLLGPSGDSMAGGSLLPTASKASGGLDLQARLRQNEMEQKAREEQAERQRMEEAQKRQAELRQQQQAAGAQAQQQAGVQNQVELVLMERISNILENSWGRSDLVSVLSTLHAEDSRVIPLLNSIEALRALVMRHSTRVALRQDPAFGSEMAVLLLTNAQFQQQEEEKQRQLQQRQAQEQEARNRARQQEELRLREQQRLEQERKQLKPIVPGAPWFYSDPQQNIQGPFRGEEMRQWLEAGYFKGDLPVSQDSSGPFRPLSAIYPDLSLAFMAPENGAAAQEEERRQAEEQERAIAEAKARELAQAEERERLQREQQQRQAAEAAERERIAKEEAAAAAQAAAEQEANESNGGNESSAQLKLMLGLAGEGGDQMEQASEPKKESPSSKRSKGKKATPTKADEPTPVAASEPTKPAKPAAPAWGGANKPVSRKSMSEIQQEEARIAALQAMERQRSAPSSGWANVAASSKTGPAATAAKPGGWNNAAAKLTPAVVVTKPGQAKTTQAAKPPTASRSRSVPVTSTTAQVSAPSNQSHAANAATDDFGAKMSPALEKWCKEQMTKLTGTDDLTLMQFCMTLTDSNEIRQYLVTYLGSSPQVNNFANEFIQRKVGAKPVKDEWETTVSTKKKGKKKSAGR
mmetsp:Transcript_20038/g.41899  ORF Transcript_20038/g.41899 Transcript_20038/m.41899 type:complete len:1092 (-) Transcript_20038:300-3575(-)|eukprot:CAMPEP_0172476576 /NCGR_PEP_ID=MMETSP1065-20121228/70443_1 /TAXON_ID=265537 /ORGANISM="Amphiprora paludosa, Strain CCMP125" /LENGTH=1091 /DNA_ID=CAMNT_0013234799 /DNA_START=121 /DNA_END=3396 /DNA_ORIENTATION=-